MMKTSLCAAMATTILATPDRYTNDPRNAVAGEAFGSMGVPTYSAPATPANCVISHDVPESGYVQGTVYTFTVSNDENLAMVGQVGNTKENSGTRSASLDISWTATAEGTTVAGALCGAGGDTDIMYVAPLVTVSAAASVVPTPTGPTPTGPTPTGPTPTPSETPCLDACESELTALFIACACEENGNDVECDTSIEPTSQFEAADACLDAVEAGNPGACADELSRDGMTAANVCASFESSPASTVAVGAAALFAVVNFF
jgi:hypothetical protein